MLTSILCPVVVLVMIGQPPAPKPRTRADAENRAKNFERYKLGGFGPNASATLGVEVKFPSDVPQGVTVLTFDVDSPAKSAGMVKNDFILEVDGSPVGLIRGRFYELWPHYGRSGEKTTEVLVSFVDGDGERRYYYLPVATAKVTGEYKSLPPDFFTAPKPITRDKAETREKNVARYVFGSANFDRYSAWELGVAVEYSSDSGATIVMVKDGSPAQRAGLRVGDGILEVDGAPIGQLGDRLYELWRQYVYSKDGTVEFLVYFTDPDTGEFRYYYPQIKLDKRTTPN